MIDVVIAVVGFLIFVVLPLGGALLALRVVMRRFAERTERDLEAGALRGPTYSSTLLLRGAMIVFLLPSLLVCFGVVVGVVGLITSDTDMTGTAVGLLMVAVPLIAVVVALAVVGFTTWTLEPDGLTRRRFGRDVSIAYSEITSVSPRLQGMVLGVASASRTIRVSQQADHYDDFFNRLLAAAPVGAGLPGAGGTGFEAELPGSGPLSFAVPRRHFVITFGLMAAGLVFMMVWPWFLVTGEQRIRDCFIFMGIGLVVWLGVVLLVSAEGIQRKVPITIDVDDDGLTLGWLRREPRRIAATEVWSSSVETNIIYVRGQPGYRYPLRIRMVDGEMIEITDPRARHMGVATQQIGSALRGRILNPLTRGVDERSASSAVLASAQASATDGRVDDAVALYKQALALFPSAERLALYRTVGDLQAGIGAHDDAAASYRAHVDLFPNDAVAWQALASSLQAVSRNDTAADAMRRAEDLLLAGAHEEPPVTGGV